MQNSKQFAQSNRIRIKEILGFLSLFLIFFSSPNLFGKNFSILHTNDLHSRLLGVGPEKTYKPGSIGDGTIGGMARLASLIKQRKEALLSQGPVLVLDAGDFTMGTLFHTIVREKGCELSLLSSLGYDATIIGNHEFDFGPMGLTKMIGKAIEDVGTLPPILASNMLLSKDDPRDQGIREWVQKDIIRRYLILERDGIRFGMFGLMGVRAAESTVNLGPITFKSSVETSREMVKFLKEEKKVDVVILISHSGVKLEDDKTTWGGEEVELVRSVPEIDIVIGGHTHTALQQPIMVGRTPIVQAGSETKYLGELSIQLDNKGVAVSQYHLHKIDEHILADQKIQKKIDAYKVDVQNLFLTPEGLTFDQPIAYVPRHVDTDNNDNTIGKLIAQSYRYATQADVGFVPDGVIRDDLYKGENGVSDIFRVLPLGVGESDDAPGYPLIKMYFTGKELKNILEILLFAYRVKGDDYFPYYAGVSFQYNPNRIPFDQIMELKLQNAQGQYEVIDPDAEDRLYSVATTAYEGKFLWIIPQLSYGLFDVTPKDKDGKSIASIKDALVNVNENNPGKPKQEFKAWKALVQYIKTLPSSAESAALPHISVTDQDKQSPMIAVNSLDPQDLFRNATWIQWTGMGLIFVAGGSLLGLSTVLLFWWRKKKFRFKNKKSLFFGSCRSRKKSFLS